MICRAKQRPISNGSLSAEDSQHLNAFERCRDLIRDRTKQVAKKFLIGCLMFGRHGGSKTVTVQETLKDLGLPWTLWKGHVTPIGLSRVLQENADDTIVIDDVFGLFTSSNTEAIQLLLAATDGRPGEPRQIKSATAGDRTSTEFRGGIIALGNALPKRHPVLDAFMSRVTHLEHDPTDEMLAAFMRSESAKGFMGLMPEECLEAVEFVIGESRDSAYRLDLRDMTQAWNDYRFWKDDGSRTHWHDLVRSSMRKSRQPEDLREIARKIFAQHPGRKDRKIRAELWRELTGGKSEDQLYRYERGRRDLVRR